MTSSINNYKIKRLLLNGHYICSSNDGLTYLLCATKIKRMLRNYKSLSIETVIFPCEITYLSQVETYDSYLIGEEYSLCMTKLQSKAYTSAQLVVMFMSFCNSLVSVLEHDLLKKQILSCLCWDNIWMDEQNLVLIWYSPKRESIIYREEDLIDKLMEILKMMYLSIRNKLKDNSLLKQIVAFTKSKPYSSPSLIEFVAYLSELMTINFPEQSKKPQSPFKIHKFNTRNRYSIDQVQSSCEKSLRFIRSNRMKTIDILTVSSRKNRNKLGKYSLFDDRKNSTISPSEHSKSRGRRRSISKTQKTHSSWRVFDDNETINTQSSNGQISNMLRTRAIEAFQTQKQHSIDVGTFVPDKIHLFDKNAKESTVTWRERFMKQKNNITSTFKEKIMHLNRKKSGEDRLMKLFKSSGKQKMATLHIQIGDLNNTIIETPEPRIILTPQKIVEVKIPQPTVHQNYYKKKQESQQKASALTNNPSFNIRMVQTKLIERTIFDQDQQFQQNQSNSCSSKQKSEVKHIQTTVNRPQSPIIRKNTDLFQNITTVNTYEPPPKASKLIVQKPKSPPFSISNLSDKKFPSKNDIKVKSNKIDSTTKQTFQEDLQQIVLENPKVKTMTTSANIKQKQSTSKIVKQDCVIHKPVERVQTQLNKEQIIKKQQQQTKKTIKTTHPTLKRVGSMNVRSSKQQAKNLQGFQLSQKQSNVQNAVESYISVINLMGEAVGKSNKVCKQFIDIQWFTGIYFIYKRFLRQRQKIQKWLQNGTCQFRREGQIEIQKQAFDKWLITQSRNTILKKIQQQNISILQSIKTMFKKLSKNCVNSKVLSAANLQTVSVHESYITAQYVINQYDDLLQKTVTTEIRQHLIQILDALYLIAELDNKQINYKVNLKDRKLMKNEEEYFLNQQQCVEQLAQKYNLS